MENVLFLEVSYRLKWWYDARSICGLWPGLSGGLAWSCTWSWTKLLGHEEIQGKHDFW